MASSATITDRKIDPITGRVYFAFSNGMTKEFGSMAALDELLNEVDSDMDKTMILAIAWFKARSSDFSNLNLVKDKAIVFDLADNNAIKLDPNSQATGIMAKAR